MRIATAFAFAACAGVASCGYCSQRVMPEDEFAARGRDRPLLAPGPGVAPPGDAAGPGATDGPATIRGTIARASGAPAPPAGAVLFLLVRPAGQEGGPPLAVRRLAPDGFPLSFAIGPAHAMIPGTEFPGRVVVEARLDADGDASTTAPGDERARSQPVAPGAEGVRLILDPGP